MSTGTPRSGPTAHPTRQQLDDLEMLMARMLALPINQVENDSGADLPVFLADPGSPPREEDEANPLAGEEPSFESVQPAGEASTSDAGVGGEEARPDSTVAVQPAESAVAVLPRLLPEAIKPLPIRVRPQVPRWVGWILWTNRTFDAWMSRLGAPGRWLRGRQGRALLGALGLLFLITAVGWMILGVVGWTW